jgi:tRNA pseudouridine(38-40) synthase
VCSGKLLVDLATVNDNNQFSYLPPLINEFLPPDIRVFSCTKVSRHFRARTSCTERHYQYLIPADFVPAGALPEFQAALKKFEHSHSFHNFTRSRGRRKERKRFREKQGRAETSAFEEMVRDPSMKRAIHRCECTGERELLAGEEVLRVHVSGTAFLLHQIRLMVGAALAVALGVLPPHSIDVALQTRQPHEVVMPMAPAEGLVLMGCNFSRSSNHLFDASLAHTSTHQDHLNLLDPEAMVGAQSFFDDTMLPHMLNTMRTLDEDETDDYAAGATTVFERWGVSDLERMQWRMQLPIGQVDWASGLGVKEAGETFEKWRLQRDAVAGGEDGGGVGAGVRAASAGGAGEESATKLSLLQDAWKELQAPVVDRAAEVVASAVAAVGNGTESIAQARGGDWSCRACGSHVFSYKTECFKCGTAKPNATNDVGGESVPAGELSGHGGVACVRRTQALHKLLLFKEKGGYRSMMPQGLSTAVVVRFRGSTVRAPLATARVNPAPQAFAAALVVDAEEGRKMELTELLVKPGRLVADLQRGLGLCMVRGQLHHLASTEECLTFLAAEHEGEGGAAALLAAGCGAQGAQMGVEALAGTAVVEAAMAAAAATSKGPLSVLEMVALEGSMVRAIEEMKKVGQQAEALSLVPLTTATGIRLAGKW